MKTAERMKYFTNAALTKTGGGLPEGAIDFTLGSPDIPPERAIIDEIQYQAGVARNYKYAVKPLPELLKAIRDWYHDRYHVSLDDDEICLLQGSQEALVNLPLVFCDPGDGVLIPDPYYPAYDQAPHLAGAEVLYMPLKQENDFLIDLDAISEEDRRKAKLMIVSYPNNPTGAVAPDWFYEKLVKFAKENDILIVHDNAYSELVFNEREGKSFLSFDGAMDVGVELNSFSKTYGMAGARLGVLCGNRGAVAAFRQLKSNLDYGIFLPVQYGGVKALRQGGSSIRPTRDAYSHRQQLAAKLFSEAGWPMDPSPATMFLWPRVPHGYDSEGFAQELAKREDIYVTPGTAFGPAGEGHVRIALVHDDDVICEAAKRIRHFFSGK